MVIHVCCKRLFLMFHLFFRYTLQVCFIWMLHMCSHIYVASVFIWMLHRFAMSFKCFSGFFASASDACSSVSLVFFYVASIASECFKSGLGCCTWDAVGSGRGRKRSPHVVWRSRRRPTAGDVRGDVGSPLERSLKV
jgi:hypothetical protein